MDHKKKQSVEWINLPVEILDLILDNLFHLSDYIRFAAVCKSWRSAAVDQKQRRRIAAVQKQPPMLLFIRPEKSDLKKYLRTGFFNLGLSELYNFGERRSYKNHQPEAAPDQVVCFGSSHGWLAIAKKRGKSITLFNPSNQKSIKIPGIPKKRYGVIEKIVMSRDPSACTSLDDDGLVLAALCQKKDYDGDPEDYEGRLALIKPGQKSWTFVRSTSVGDYLSLESVVDVIFHKGLLYLMCGIQYSLVAIDYGYEVVGDKPRGAFRFVLIGYKRRLPGIPLFTYPSYFGNHLVEASNGDLLLVQAHLGPSLSPNGSWDYGVTALKVYKLETEKVGAGLVLIWVQIFKLDNDDAIFVADNTCFCISGAGAGAGAGSGYHPNSIYFAFNTKDKRYYYKHYKKYRRGSLNDMGVLNLGDYKLRNHSGLESFRKFILPIALLSPSLS